MEKTIPTIKERAEAMLATYHPISHDCDLKSDLYPDSTVLMAMVELATKQQSLSEARIKELEVQLSECYQYLLSEEDLWAARLRNSIKQALNK